MTLDKRIRSKGLLFDGSMGSLLLKYGLKGGIPPESWNLEKPESIQGIHEDYIQAGSDVIQTNTFGGTRIKLSKNNLGDMTEEINRNAVKIAKNSAQPDTLIAGDIGPTGELMAPYGLMSREEARDTFKEQAFFLTEEGVDLILIETMYDLEEALAAIDGVRSFSDIPLFVTMTFEKKPTGYVTIMGNRPVESLQMLLDRGADVVGANCSIGSSEMVDLAKELRDNIFSPLIIQPNAGIPRTIEDQVLYPEDADLFAKNLMEIKGYDVEIIGGCCGTTPEYIRKIREKLSKEEIH